MRRVGIVLVAHASALARGAAEVARQMAPGVPFEAVGGFDVAGQETLGTDVERVHAAVTRLLAEERDVVVLGDLGSAVLAAGLVVDLLEPAAATRVRVAEGPFVEGAVAAGVAAAGGAGLEEVAHVVVRAAGQWADGAATAASDRGAAAGVDTVGDGELPEGAVRVVLGNTTGLHARPAAVLATLVASLGATVTLDGAPADSIFELMKLGIAGGQEVEIVVAGEGAAEAREAVVAAVESGLGER